MKRERTHTVKGKKKYLGDGREHFDEVEVVVEEEGKEVVVIVIVQDRNTLNRKGVR